MKKVFYTLCVLIGCLSAEAQVPCTSDMEQIDTTYPYYLFERPCPTDGVLISDPTDNFVELDSVEFRGVRYYSQQPILVYGIASMGNTNYERYQFAVARLSKNNGIEIFTYLQSTPSHNYDRGPMRYMYLPYRHNQSYLCVELHEEYFDQPVIVEDTFYVGIVRDFSISCHGSTFPHGLAPDTIIRNSPPLDNLLYWGQGKRFYPYTTRRYFWGGFFPIIHPYDGDSLVCDPVKNFHLVQRGPSYPTFAWDTSSQLEQDWFQLQYAPYGSGNWRTVETTEPSLRVVASFDPSIYYQARIRAVCHHVCPGHDTVLYSTWSDTIRFYTGSTEPTDITLVEGRADLFTLMPNPARGEVTVELGGSVDGKGVLTLTDGLGREVLWQSAVNGQQSVVSISLKEFPSGVYFVTLRTEKYTATRKLVVEN